MTPNVPGDLLILFALGSNVVAGLAYLLTARGRRGYDHLARMSYALFVGFTGLAVAYLYYLFYSHNFAIKYVAEYSERAQAPFYILSAFWGGQEGTYLLWLFFGALFGFIILRKGGQYKYSGMAVYCFINLFFLAILTKLSPFALLPSTPVDGQGLNPLLRDPWMVIHPPVIFVGYAMAAVPFAIAMAALITNDYSGWLKRVFPWVGITALALGAGNILGGFWAYKTLGWGGFWAWDPVENSSFIPWVFALALLHGLIIERRTGALRKINLLLTSLVFLLVIYGTFLTRSGVLADFSVHSFTDLGINVYLIGFMIAFLILTAVVLAVRRRGVPTVPLDYNYFGREFSLFSGLVLLVLFGLIVLAWTSLPLLTKLVGVEPRAAEIATYNHFAVPLVIVMSLMLTLSPVVWYDAPRLEGWKKRLGIVLVSALVLSFGLFVGILGADVMFGVLFTVVITAPAMLVFRPDLRRALIPGITAFVAAIAVGVIAGMRDYLFLLFVATGLMAAASNVVALVKHLPARWRAVGGPLTHFGFGMMVIGILASAAFTSSEKLVIPRGESRSAFDLTIAYDGMAEDMRIANNELRLRVSGGGDTIDARPQLYFSERMQGTMKKPYIRRTWLKDYYLAPEQVQASSEESELVLTKGETKRIGDFSITFKGFDLGTHGDMAMSGGMRVGAKLEVASAGAVTEAQPAVEHGQDSLGNTTITRTPAMIAAGGKSYFVELRSILADQGAVRLAIPGLTDSVAPETLVLDVSRKPLINLAWAGALLVLLGTVVSIIRRIAEAAPATDANRRS